MRPVTTDALLLRAVDFGESDRIVHVLVPHAGRLTGIAKGARRSKRRFGGNLDLFNRLRIQIAPRRRPGSMARLEAAILVEAFQGIRRRPRSFALGCYLLELVDRLSPENAAPREARAVFTCMLDALRVIDRTEPDARLRVLLELRALAALGLCPELRHCVRCGKEAAGAGTVGFDVADGGPVCPGCATPSRVPLPVAIGTLRSLEQGLRLRIDQLARLSLGPRALEEALRVVHRFQRFHVGFELRSEAFLDRVLATHRGPA